ncbi:MAG: hypothetical protein ACM3O9_08985 [Methylocystaceae bacterium]
MAKYLVVLAVIMLMTAIISIRRQDKPGVVWHAELKDLIYEAQIAREDLEAMLQNVQVASEEVVKTLDEAIATRCEQFEDTLTTVANRATAQPTAPPPPFSLDDMRRAHPYIMAPRLKEMGYSIVQIAEFLDRSTGEVELTLSMADKKQKIG